MTIRKKQSKNHPKRRLEDSPLVNVVVVKRYNGKVDIFTDYKTPVFFADFEKKKIELIPAYEECKRRTRYRLRNLYKLYIEELNNDPKGIKSIKVQDRANPRRTGSRTTSGSLYFEEL